MTLSVKKIIGALVIISIFSIFVYQTYFKKEKLDFTLAEVIKGDVLQEVLETGQVKKEEKINLSFKSAGIIEETYVEVGEEVKERDILAKLENTQLKIQLQEAEANLELNQAQLNKLLRGASSEEIQITQTSVDNAKISLATAKQKLEDIKEQGEENLEAAYEDALNVLNDSYLKISNIFNTADLIQRTYFINTDQQGFRVRENKDRIENALNRIKPYLDTAKATQKYEDIDITLSKMKGDLEIVSDALKIIRDTCEDQAYKNTVSSTHKSSLDTDRGYINTALTNVVNSQQTISSTKTTNVININTYQGKIDLDEGELKAAEDNLAKIIAPPRQEDIDLYQAQTKQAAAKIQLLEKQIEDTILRTPVDGQVVKVNKSIGEIVQSTLQDAVIILLPSSPFKIEVDIYEEDIVDIKVDNPVEITLVAFSDDILKGRVISIDPAEKLIGGIVYYEVTIDFEETKEGIKPGMTADIIIESDKKENVLVIPKRAVKKMDGKKIVQVFKDGEIKEREIEIGLKGNEYIEVISGLQEGEKVVID
ncbi:MAG: efflux RND transporter periplasmic adaptor subunit [Candidatus Nealsonbacteria bacterium]